MGFMLNLISRVYSVSLTAQPLREARVGGVSLRPSPYALYCPDLHLCASVKGTWSPVLTQTVTIGTPKFGERSVEPE